MLFARILLMTSLVAVSLSFDSDLAIANTNGGEKEGVPSLNEILGKWTAAMSVETPRQLQFEYYEYDRVFLQELRGSGSFTLDATDRAQYSIVPVDITDDADSRKSHEGVLYELRSVDGFEFYWTNSEVYLCQPAQATASRMPRRSQGSSRGWFAGFANPQTFVPLMLGIDQTELQKMFDWKIDQDWKQQDNEIHLIADPKTDLMKRNCKRMEILLDRRSFEPLAIRKIDLSGTKEYIYKVKQKIDAHGEFWKPDLSGYNVQ